MTRMAPCRITSAVSVDAAGGISAGVVLPDRIARGEGSSKAAMVGLDSWLCPPAVGSPDEAVRGIAFGP